MAYAIVAHADDSLDPTIKNLLPQFNTFTPEAAALGKYGTYGMTEYSGVPNISIPFFSLKSGNFELPMEISYDASGIKVEQEATYVGLGWNLIMGGCINHIVCGKNDFADRRTLYVGPTKFEHNELNHLGEGIETTQTETPHPLYITLYANSILSCEGHPAGTWYPKDEDKPRYNILRDVAEGYLIPDIFQASFFGHNVSFVINQDSQPYKAVIISDNATKYKIDIETKGSYLGNITITDDNGMKYIFSHFDYNEFIGQRYSYYLWKVTDPSNRCLAEYKYQQTTKTQCISDPYFETKGLLLSGPYHPLITPFVDTHGSKDWGYKSTSIKKVYPESITTLNEKVTFTLEDRTDDKSCKRIKGIYVNSLSGSLIHKVFFNYGDYNVSSGNQTRLKLTGVNIDDKKYSFEYNGQDLPSMTSKGQDYWGYYNGKDGQKDYCASPKYKINNNEIIIAEDPIGEADRYASAELCKVGILNKIVYPTGGYTVFDYEINHFNDPCDYFYPSSGSKIYEYPEIALNSTVGPNSSYEDRTKYTTKEYEVKERTEFNIECYCGCSSKDWFKSYHTIQKKNDKGVFVFFKEYCIQQENKKNSVTKLTLDSGLYRIVSTFETTSTTMNPEVTSAITIYKQKKYHNVTTKDDGSGKSIGGGLRVKSMYSYDSNGDLLGGTKYSYQDGKLLIPTVRKEIISFIYSNYDGNQGFNTYSSEVAYVASSPAYPAICSLGSSHVGYSTVIKEVLDKSEKTVSKTVSKYHNSAYTNIDSYNMFYEPVMGMNGKLLESTTYSVDGTKTIPMHNIRYNYSRKGIEPDIYVKDKNGNQRLEPSVEVVFFPWCRPTCFDQANVIERNFKLSIYPKRNIWTYVTSVTETIYDNGKAMKPVTTTYEYKESNYQPTDVTKSVELKNNVKDVLSTKYWYPEDSEVSNSNTACLTNAHCISEKVKAVEYKNGKTVGGYRNDYGSLSNGLPVVKKNYSIDTSNSEILELDVTNYDNYGNIREYKKKDGTPVTIIWSYNHQYPIMEIVGKTYNQVKTAYSSITSLEDKPSVAETTMSSIHATLRKNMPDALVTAYTYSPWHTVSEIIQPNGNKTKYAYDSYGRLEETKDINDKTLLKYSYNYKNK